MPRKKLPAQLDLTIRVDAHFLGVLLIELAGQQVEIIKIGAVVDVPKPKTKPKSNGSGWTAQRRATFKRTLKKKKKAAAAAVKKRLSKTDEE